MHPALNRSLHEAVRKSNSSNLELHRCTRNRPRLKLLSSRVGDRGPARSVASRNMLMNPSTQKPRIPSALGLRVWGLSPIHIYVSYIFLYVSYIYIYICIRRPPLSASRSWTRTFPAGPVVPLPMDPRGLPPPTYPHPVAPPPPPNKSNRICCFGGRRRGWNHAFCVGCTLPPA